MTPIEQLSKLSSVPVNRLRLILQQECQLHSMRHVNPSSTRVEDLAHAMVAIVQKIGGRQSEQIAAIGDSVMRGET